MITVFGMPSCPDCAIIEEQIKGNPNFRFIDIGAHVMNLKSFLRIRDIDPIFDAAKAKGAAGIPCFVREDGSVTLDPSEVGLGSAYVAPAPTACSLDGSGC